MTFFELEALVGCMKLAFYWRVIREFLSMVLTPSRSVVVIFRKEALDRPPTDLLLDYRFVAVVDVEILAECCVLMFALC